MNAAYSMGPLADRKRALIKKLSGQNNGAGGAARLSAGTPFGALPRLGFSPNARSVFGRNENFNFEGAPQGFQSAVPNVSAPGLASMQGIGPSAGVGSGSPGLPQGMQSQTAPSANPFGMGNDASGGTGHVLGISVGSDGITRNADTGSIYNEANPVPMAVRQAMESGAMSTGVNAWLKQNPWFLSQLDFAGGGRGGGVL